MGANITEKAITNASKRTGGVIKTVETFKEEINILRKSSVHFQKSSADDEKVISHDLRSLRPFKKEDERSLESFVEISHNPTASFDGKIKFTERLNKAQEEYFNAQPLPTTN